MVSTIKTLALAGLFALAPATLTQADLKVDGRGFATLQAGEESWSEYPGIAGISRMVVYGDPSKAGVYVIRAKFAPGVMSMPHTHPEDRLATVIKGTWWSGTGVDFAPDRTEPMRPGAYMLHPAGEAHFDGAKEEEVIVQLIGYGPSGTKFIRPELGTVGRSLP
jgi:quercetin dioxygenase-like cupin family protein